MSLEREPGDMLGSSGGHGHVARAMTATLRRLLPALLIIVGFQYVAFAIFYTTQSATDGFVFLAGLTAISSVGFIGVGFWIRDRELSELATHVVIGGAVVGVVCNVAAEYGVSQNPLHSVGFVLAQLAASALLPSWPWIIGFIAVNMGAWLGTTYTTEIPLTFTDISLAFLSTTMMTAMVFYMRTRNTALIESLRLSVEESRDRDLREAVDKNPDCVLLLRDESIVYANAAIAWALGYGSPGQLVGRRLAELVTARSAPQLEGLLGESEPEATTILELARRDGETIAVEILEPRTIQFQRDLTLMLVGRDVTESREALHAQLVEADSVAIAGRLAGGLAHELNNPLAAVTLSLGLLRDGLDENDERSTEEVLDELEDGIDRLAAIVSDLSAVSSLEDGDVSQVDVARALEQAVDVAFNQIRHRAAIERDIRPAPPVVMSRGKLIQVFTNLLVNAVGRLDGQQSSDALVVVASRPGRSKRTVVEVRVSGVYIPPAERKQLFEPFFTTTSDQFGAGLGLYYCHSVIAAAGGVIEVDSAPNRGTVFRVTLPAAPDASTDKRPLPRPVASGGRRARVLVIDDEPVVARALKRVLSRSCDVTVAPSGADGIAAYEEQRPDLVLCDIMMPEMNGVAVYEALREDHPEIHDRLVFITGGAFTKDTREFLDRTDIPVLKKPIDRQMLESLVRR